MHPALPVVGKGKAKAQEVVDAKGAKAHKRRTGMDQAGEPPSRDAPQPAQRGKTKQASNYRRAAQARQAHGTTQAHNPVKTCLQDLYSAHTALISHEIERKLARNPSSDR